MSLHFVTAYVMTVTFESDLKIIEQGNIHYHVLKQFYILERSPAKVVDVHLFANAPSLFQNNGVPNLRLPENSYSSINLGMLCAPMRLLVDRNHLACLLFNNSNTLPHVVTA